MRRRRSHWTLPEEKKGREQKQKGQLQEVRVGDGKGERHSGKAQTAEINSLK